MLHDRSRYVIAGSLTVVVAVSLLAALPAAVYAQRPGGAVLDVETIMQDPKWIGEAPAGVVWSDDSRWIYFRWNPEG